MELSVITPVVPTRPERLVRIAALAERTRSGRLWCGQSMTLEQHHLYAYLTGLGFRVEAGLGVSLMPFRHPLQGALEARSIAATTGRPVIAGFGPGATALQASMHGEPYARPLRAAREYLTVVRTLLDGRPCRQEGDYFSFTGELMPMPTPRIDVGLGVLRPGMARLAGEVADVAITWLAPAPYLHDVVRPALEEGAQRAGRPVPKLVAVVPMALDRPDRDPAVLARTPHLRFPHYQDMLRRAGVDVNGEDPDATAAALVDGDVFLVGDPSALDKKLDAHRAAGVDELVVNLAGVAMHEGPTAAAADLEEILAGVDR